MKQIALNPLLLLILWGLLLGCGISKELNHGAGPHPMPDWKSPDHSQNDENTLKLKQEELNLTYLTQAWRLNQVQELKEAGNYSLLQKKFSFPIQFNGWIAVDHVISSYADCAAAQKLEPRFVLLNDHNEELQLQPGEKYGISLERLYKLQVEVDNITFCNKIEVQFGVLYDTKE